MYMHNANCKADKTAEKIMLSWFASYVEARGALPRVGVTMFPVPGMGVTSRSVECSVTGRVIASFTSYESATAAIARCDRALRARVLELSADSI